MTWQQIYNPTGSMFLSTLLAAIPVVVMLGALGFFHIKAHIAAGMGLVAALLVAVFAYGMPIDMAGRAAMLGGFTGLLPIGWIVLNIIFLHQLTEQNGSFKVLQDSLSGITEDRRIQLLLIAFCFGAFFEGAAGFGTPVAVTAAILIGLGFSPLAASGLSLIANTAPVAFGALGTPVITLAQVHGYDLHAVTAMIGTARSERDGTLIFAPAAGTVVAQLEWQTDQSVPLAETMPQLTGKNTTNYKLFFAEHSAALSPSAPDGDGLCRTRHLQLEVFGLPLPCAVEETTYYGQQQEMMYRTEAQALTLARLQGLRALHDAFPDAEIFARREECTVQEDALHYHAVYTVAADICT